jgi:Lrp/AsnC family transcriptional regulator
MGAFAHNKSGSGFWRDLFMPPQLDSIDMNILALLQQDASLSTAEIADRVGVSQSPCWRRIQHLKDEGFIRSTVALLDCHKVGFHMTIFAQVKMVRLTDEGRKDFVRRVNDIPEIIECYAVFGDIDALMKIVAPDVTWYQEFMFSVLMKLPGVQDVRSIMTLMEAKNTSCVPLKIRKFR